MQTPENLFKKALAQGELRIGLWVALADPYAAELCATCGFDWLLLDGEHAPNDLRSLLGALQSVAPYGAHPVVRIPKGDDALIKQVLDIGATTLMVPMVESADQARQLVRAMRYPPHGIRGVGSGIARSARWSQYPNYLHEANERVCLLVQVETREALARIEDIASVDGIDGVFIGPNDLAASFGHIGNWGHAEVQSALEDAVKRLKKIGKPAGILTPNEEEAKKFIQWGYTFVAVGADLGLLAKNADALAKRFKP